jgi:hypothetical protein
MNRLDGGFVRACEMETKQMRKYEKIPSMAIENNGSSLRDPENLKLFYLAFFLTLASYLALPSTLSVISRER